MSRLQKCLPILIGTAMLVAAKEQVPAKFSGFQVTSQENEKKLEFNNQGFELRQIEMNGEIFVKPEMSNADAVVNPGQPYLPTISTYYAVEPGKSYSVNLTILEEETVTEVDVMPFETWDSKKTGLVTKGDEYLLNEFFPSELATVSDPIILRGLSMVQVSLTPFQYNPQKKELTIIHSAEMELVESGETEMPFVPAKRSRAFESLYESLVVNYESLNRDEDEYQRPSILYVLPNNIGNLMSTVEALMDWKHRVGYEVNYVSSSNVVNNKNNLKNYIEDAYETWENPPVHVTIIGDAEGSYDIPTWNETWSGYNGEGDHPYSLLEGNDQYPEVFLGRISFDTNSNLQTIVSKTINYESNPYMNENWFQRACLVGDPSSSGISCIITNEHIHEILDMVGFEEINTVYSGSFASQMQAGISEGVSFFNYRGYYGVSGFTSGNVNNTSNGWMLPVATVITCGTGSFASGEALSESFIRAGTANNPKGSVVCIGTATLGTHTMFNNIVDMGFYYGALLEGIESAGGALMYGKMMLHKNYPSNPNNYPDIFSHWNTLMGESSLPMWSDYPEATIVEHPYSMTKGTNFIDITVDKESGPVEDAWVTILMDGVTGDIFESAYTNAQGFVRLPITSSDEGEVFVTVTKKNHYPYQSSFQIYDPGVSINIEETTVTIDDDHSGNSLGNGDGIANGGETIELYFSATNFGSVDSETVSGVLSSNNPHVTVIDNIVEYDSVSAGETIAAPYPFLISLEDGLEDGSNLELMVYFIESSGYTGNGMVPIGVAGNKLEAIDIDVIGSASDILTPGESSYLKIQLENTGSTYAIGVTGIIHCASPFIEILDDTGTWMSVANGGMSYNSNDYFEVSAVNNAIPGTVAHLIVNVTTSNGYESNSILPIQIGSPTVNDPYGPDDYGYYVYDSGDLDYMISPGYNWVEVDSRYGGEGTYLNSLSDNGNNGDDVETISLPFLFRFYGQEYDEISICSNGWLSMGETTMASFRNYELPGVGGPGAMIAVFWDDLKLTNQGRVYTWYDDVGKKFYVQWSRVRTYQNNSTETFQAVLLDPSYYTTPTGDGEILLQYMEFNNTSYGSYSWDQIHGNYCTVGIEDHTMTQGLQYTFNDVYPTAAMELGDGTALLITTRGSDIRLEGDLNFDEQVDIFDILLLVDFILGHEGMVNPYFADITGDGMVNIMDMIRLLYIVMGYVN